MEIAMLRAKRTALTTILVGTLGIMGHAACNTSEPTAQSADVTEQADACRIPRILFVVDASASMLDTIEDAQGGETSKWEALAGAVQSLTDAHQGTAAFGLMTFPGQEGGCSAGDVLIEPGAYNERAINQQIAELPIASNAATPAGQTLVKAAQSGLLSDAEYDNYVVFISDGWQYCSVAGEGAPTCAAPADCAALGMEDCGACNACQVNDSSEACQGQTGDGCYCVRNWPVLGVQALADAGVKTYVVGFGGSVDALTLNQAAMVGGDPLPDCDPSAEEQSCYLPATSPGELTAALDNIMLRLTREPCEGGCGIRGKRTCTIDGWSECQAPDAIRCTTTCGEGTQQCTDGELSECSAACGTTSSTGGGGSGTAASSGQGGGTTTTSSGGTGGSAVGGAGTTSASSGPGGASSASSGVGGSSSRASSTGAGAGDAGDTPWDPPDDYGDDYGDYGDGFRGEGSGGSAAPASDGASEGGCAYAPRRSESSGHLALMALGLAAALGRRRRR
jgi:hypothetical protein